ncbi:RHS repeat-associated core domain-containing protein [Luteolibacter sp. LG18]|uniref:RHS repeat-associated core domain-containing protein n=1 Tax=Luteolibacter sp. LG18 TaxID=2819286 RepID=UPI0030C6E5FD
MVDRRGKVYEFDHDTFDHETATRTPDGKVFAKTYTAEGRVLTDSQNSTQLISYSYESGTGRVHGTTYPDAYVENVEYDGKGQLKRSVEGSKEVKRTYDVFDRVRTYTNSEGWTIGYEYYNDGLIKKIYYPEKDSNPFDNPCWVSYQYDQTGKLTQVTDWNNKVTSYAWRPDGKLLTVTRPNGTKRTLMYDSIDRVAGFEERSNNALLLFNRFNYRKTDDLSGRYNYPSLPANQTLTPITSATYTSDNALLTVNGVGCQHDGRGNMTQGPLSLASPATAQSLTFDWRNRLTAIGTAASYTYDQDGHRVKMQRGSDVTEYVFDPHGGALTRMLLRKDASGATVRCVYGLGLEYEVETPSGGGTAAMRFHHPDHTGSSVVITDGTGAVTARQSYDPYGRVIHSSGIWNSAFGYAGYLGVMTDPDGLVWMRARFYSPVLGRFISMDPSRFEGGMNWYAYAGGNPIQFGDPTGLGPMSTLDAIQTGLSILGMLPVIGPAFDLVNAGISMARGDFVGAAAHAFAALPGIGDMAGAAMLGGRAIAMEMRMGGEIAAETASLGKSLRCTAPTPWKGGSGFCFVAGTPIATAEGSESIENLHVGDRVLTTSGSYSATEVDPATWRKITVTLACDDLSKEQVKMELLRSNHWITNTGCASGKRIWMEIGDLGLQGWADVHQIEACPPIQPGTGRVVLSTMTRTGASTVDLKLENGTEIEATPTHPLYSITRGEWTAISDLQEGEVLASKDGQAIVDSVTPDQAGTQVFNLEVEGDHCYFVGRDQLLAHNQCFELEGVKRGAKIPNPSTSTGVGFGVNDSAARIQGPWTKSDLFNGLYGRSPKSLGRPDLHHAQQMPGSAIHEIEPSLHRGNAALHPNKFNQGVTNEMRMQDRQLHWWYRAREQGAEKLYPNHVYD